MLINQMITPQGKLTLQSLVKSLNLVPNTIIIVKTDGDPMPIIEALQAIELPFTVPIITMKNDENLLTCRKKDLEEALEILARENPNGGHNPPTDNGGP